MKFTLAWAEVLTQNIALRVAVLALSGCLIAVLVVLVKVSLKEPLIIERACHTSTLESSSPERTEKEIAAFIVQALKARFDTGADDSVILSEEEARYREQEQKDLNGKGIHQRIVFNSVKEIAGTQVTVDADRLISVGPVRSAFSFPLLVTIGSVKRTENNPYGLRLIQVKPLQEGKKDEK